MKPNLERIPADGDTDARAILNLARGRVSVGLLGSLTETAEGPDFLPAPPP